MKASALVVCAALVLVSARATVEGQNPQREPDFNRQLQQQAETDKTWRAASDGFMQFEKITYRNANHHFRFDPFSIRAREQCTVGALRAEAAGHDVSIQSKGRRVEHHEPMTMAGFAPTA